MKPTNRLNNKYVKTLGLIGGVAGIGFSIYRKTTFWRGAGNYLLFTLTGSLIGMAIYEATKKTPEK